MHKQYIWRKTDTESSFKVGQGPVQLIEQDLQELFIVKSHERMDFDRRTRSRVKLLHCDASQVILRRNHRLYVWDGGPKIPTYDIPTLNVTRENLCSVGAHGAIFGGDNTATYINFAHKNYCTYTFDWRVFSGAVKGELWAVGTRQSVDGPGKLYLLSAKGELLWEVNFLEQFNTQESSWFIPYHIAISDDYEHVIVSSLDTVYVLSTRGELIARICLSEPSIKEYKEHRVTFAEMTKPDTLTKSEVTGLRNLFSGSPKTKYPRVTVFCFPQRGLLLWQPAGQLTLWTLDGNLRWSITFDFQGFVGQLHVIDSTNFLIGSSKGTIIQLAINDSGECSIVLIQKHSRAIHKLWRDSHENLIYFVSGNLLYRTAMGTPVEPLGKGNIHSFLMRVGSYSILYDTDYVWIRQVNKSDVGAEFKSIPLTGLPSYGELTIREEWIVTPFYKPLFDVNIKNGCIVHADPGSSTPVFSEDGKYLRVKGATIHWRSLQTGEILRSLDDVVELKIVKLLPNGMLLTVQGREKGDVVKIYDQVGKSPQELSLDQSIRAALVNSDAEVELQTFTNHRIRIFRDETWRVEPLQSPNDTGFWGDQSPRRYGEFTVCRVSGREHQVKFRDSTVTLRTRAFASEWASQHAALLVFRVGFREVHAINGNGERQWRWTSTSDIHGIAVSDLSACVATTDDIIVLNDTGIPKFIHRLPVTQSGGSVLRLEFFGCFLVTSNTNHDEACLYVVGENGGIALLHQLKKCYGADFQVVSGDRNETALLVSC